MQNRKYSRAEATLPAGPPATHAADAPARRAAKPNRTTTNASNVNALHRAKGAAQPPRRRRRGRPRRRRLPRLPPVLLCVLRGSPLHAVNIRPIHPIFFSRSSARALVLSLFRTHVRMAIEAAFPTTCSSLVTSPASSPLFLSGMESVSAGRVQAGSTGAILS